MKRPGLAFLVAVVIFLLGTQPSNAQAVSPPPRVAPPTAGMSAADLEKRGDELRTQKNWLDALDYYRAAVKKHRTGLLYKKLGIVELQMQRLKDAEKDFNSAIKMERTDPEAWNNRGASFYAMKKFGRAVKDYRKAIALNDEVASFHSNLGTAYFAQKDFEKAAAEYRRALEIDPEIFDRRSMSGVIAQMMDQEDRAHYAYVLAKMFAHTGNTDKALLYLRKAMEDGYKQIGDVYKDEAFVELRKDPRFAELMISKPVAIPQ